MIFLAFYKSGAQAFLISVSLIFLLLILMVLNNTYRISLKNNKINIIGLFNKKETINCNNFMPCSTLICWFTIRPLIKW